MGVNMCFNLSETLVTKFTTGNDDDALVDALTSNELVNEVGQAAHIIKAFDAAHHDNPRHLLPPWRQYMKLVSILLRFTRAIREGKWDLSLLRAMFCCVRAFRVFIWLNQVVDLSLLSEMLPYFAAFDHSNYTR